MGFGKRMALDETGALSGFEWVLIYRSEKIELISWDEADKEEIFSEDAYRWDENLEVRAFSREKELHLFLTEEGPAAVYTEFGTRKNTKEEPVAVHTESGADEHTEKEIAVVHTEFGMDINPEAEPAAIPMESGASENKDESYEENYEENYMEEKYRLAERFQVKSGGERKNTLIVRKLLAFDEDGQAYVRQTCLAGLEG